MTTYFRAVVQSGGCPTATSTAAQVTVNPTSVGGTATPTAGAVCSGSATTIVLAGQTGSIVKWQSSTNNVTWTDIYVHRESVLDRQSDRDDVLPGGSAERHLPDGKFHRRPSYDQFDAHTLGYGGGESWHDDLCR